MAPRSSLVSDGLMYFGVPVSGATAAGDGFVRATLDKAVSKIEAEHLKIKTALARASAQALYAIVIYCMRSQMDYLTQLVYPSLGPWAVWPIILGFLEHTLGTPLAKLLDSEGVTLTRIRPPARLGELGTPPSATSALAAFVSAAHATATRLIGGSGTHSGGAVERGFLSSQLAPLFGAGSFDGGNESTRFCHWLRRPLATSDRASGGSSLAHGNHSRREMPI